MALICRTLVSDNLIFYPVALGAILARLLWICLHKLQPTEDEPTNLSLKLLADEIARSLSVCPPAEASFTEGYETSITWFRQRLIAPAKTRLKIGRRSVIGHNWYELTALIYHEIAHVASNRHPGWKIFLFHLTQACLKHTHPRTYRRFTSGFYSYSAGLTRHEEFAADRIAAKRAGRKNLIWSLIKLNLNSYIEDENDESRTIDTDTLPLAAVAMTPLQILSAQKACLSSREFIQDWLSFDDFRRGDDCAHPSVLNRMRNLGYDMDELIETLRLVNTSLDLYSFSQHDTPGAADLSL